RESPRRRGQLDTVPEATACLFLGHRRRQDVARRSPARVDEKLEPQVAAGARSGAQRTRVTEPQLVEGLVYDVAHRSRRTRAAEVHDLAEADAHPRGIDRYTR